MIFPIGDEQVQGGYFPLFSYSFIAINIAVFLLQASLQAQGQLSGFITEYGAIPVEIVAGEDWHTLISSMFMHGGWMHLIGNMVFLWVFADNIEATVGNLTFLIFYVCGGLAAVAGHIYFEPASTIPMVGASGAISAVMGAYLVMFPKSKIKMLFFITFISIPAFVFLLFWIGQQMVAGFASFDPVSLVEDNVAYWAHIGGFVFGLAAGLLFRAMGKIEGVVVR
jgi:membrane associated rhomboid family serine protease